jgi:hypothetical protein
MADTHCFLRNETLFDLLSLSTSVLVFDINLKLKDCVKLLIDHE